MLGYWPYATHKKTFKFFLSKHIASQLNVNTKMESSKPSFILQELQET